MPTQSSSVNLKSRPITPLDLRFVDALRYVEELEDKLKVSGSWNNIAPANRDEETKTDDSARRLPS